ncbi:MAG: EAL domain-containing protein [Massilia sp.]
MSTNAESAASAPGHFTRRLVLCVLMLNLCILALAGLSIYDSHRHYGDRARIDAQNLTRVFEQSLTGTLEKVELTLLSVEEEFKWELASGSFNAEKMNAFLAYRQAQMPELGGLRVADEAGIVRYGLGVRQDQKIDVSQRPTFQRMKDSPSVAMAIEPPTFSRIDSKWVLPVGRRISRPDGSFGGVVYTAIPLSFFTDSFAGLDIGRAGTVSLRDATTGLLARYPTPREASTPPGNADASPQLRQVIEEGRLEGSFFNTTPIDGIERFTAFRKIPDTPLYIIVGLATTDYLASWRQESAMTGGLVLLFIVVLLALSHLLYRGWHRQTVAVNSLREQREFLHTIVECEPECVKVIGPDGELRQMNRAGLAMLEVDSIEEANRVGTLSFIDAEYREQFSRLNARVLHGDSGRLEYRIRGMKGTLRWLETHASPLRNARGDITSVVAVTRDITERKSANEQIEFLAYHDALTKLPNRLMAKDHMAMAMSYAQRAGAKAALLFLDLDDFKTINDTLGHLLGDDLLKMIAVRLRECINPTDTLSRHGGDEFLVVLSDMRDFDGMIDVAEKISACMKRPYSINGHSLLSSFSIGIAVYPDDGNDFETLLKKAGTALFQAKLAGRDIYRFYAEQMNINAGEDLRIRTHLGHALEFDEFVLHYQPQIDLASGAVIGAEALIRLQHDELGLVPPGRFIPIAEACGLIVPIGAWVIREACRQAVAWRDAGLPGLVIAVNLSSVQFQRGGIEKQVAQALTESGLDPGCLELELTESILIQDTENVLATVARLKALGVKLSIDDFGTGYSSLSYLKRFSVDKLKIDQSFVRNMADNPSDATIVRAIIQIARSLNLKTIAEGVEDERSLKLLNIQRCDEAQGFHFARPMPADEFAAFMAERVANSQLSGVEE